MKSSCLFVSLIVGMIFLAATPRAKAQDISTVGSTANIGSLEVLAWGMGSSYSESYASLSRDMKAVRDLNLAYDITWSPDTISSTTTYYSYGVSTTWYYVKRKGIGKLKSNYYNYDFYNVGSLSGVGISPSLGYPGQY